MNKVEKFNKEFEQSTKWIFFIIATGFLITLIIFFYKSQFGNFVYEIFEKNLGPHQTSIIFFYLKPLIIVGILLLLICAFFRLSMGLRISIQKKNRSWLLLMFSAIFFFFLIGMFFLDTIGAQYLKLNLIKNGEFYQGNVSCYEMNGRKLIYVGDKFVCNFYPGEPLYEPYNIIRLKQTNGTEITKLFDNPPYSLEFIAPANVESINLEIIGEEMNSKQKVIFSSSYSYTFLTREEFEEKREKFISYILGLLGLIILLTPSLIINIREIISK